MPIKFCPQCTTIEEGSERSDSPDLPSPRTAIGRSASRDSLPNESVVTDSRVTSARTEDLRDIQRIFEEANSAPFDLTPAEDWSDSPKSSPRKSIIGSLFRKTLLRTRSRSTGILLNDADQLKRTKSELRRTLLTGQVRDAGGYDLDAAVLDDVEATLMQQANNSSTERSRDKNRQDDDGWPQRYDFAMLTAILTTYHYVTVPRGCRPR
jgi:hypothetical protein